MPATTIFSARMPVISIRPSGEKRCDRAGQRNRPEMAASVVGLAGFVGADQRHDLAASRLEIDARSAWVPPRCTWTSSSHSIGSILTASEIGLDDARIALHFLRRARG